MNIKLPLDKMSLEDKIQVIEEIWENICRTEADFPSPSWHHDVLLDRETRLDEKSSNFKDWKQARKDIRNSVQ